MHLFLTVLHVMVCLVLMLVVLLQRGKGADMGAMLGGGSSQTVFGSRGAGNFLTKTTAVCAVIFMVTSLTLSYLGNLGTAEELIFDDSSSATEPAEPATGDLLQEVPSEAAPSGSSGALEEVPQEPPTEGQPTPPGP
jgi:preprotein translocase subunit SecG